jgi:hypothetical protein
MLHQPELVWLEASRERGLQSVIPAGDRHAFRMGADVSILTRR